MGFNGEMTLGTSSQEGMPCARLMPIDTISNIRVYGKTDHITDNREYHSMHFG